MPFRMRRPSSGKPPADQVSQTVQALQDLQKTLHNLTPAEQARVQATLPFAASEWLQGLANSIGSFEGSSHGGSHGKGMHALDVSNSSSRSKQLDALLETADDARARLTPNSGKVVLVMVGIPARGKSILCHKLEHFLCWRGTVTKAFKVGSYRRGEILPQGGLHAAGSGARPGPATGPAARPQFSGASFFDSTKAFAGAQREKVSLDAFDELLKWLSEDASEIAIFDASNVTMKRRALLQEKINAHSERCGIPPMSLVFIESICTDESVIREQMLFKVHHSPDFATMAEADALADLQQRIEHYEKIYDTVREEEGAYIKMFDLRAKASVCNIYGRMSKSVLPFLLALHWHPRPFFLYVLPRDAGAEPSAALGARHSALCEWAAAYPRKGELQILTSTEVRARCNAPVTKCGALHCATRCAHCTAPWHATACCTRRAPSPLPMCSPTRWAARRGPASGRCSHLSARPRARPPWPLCPSLAT